jgi:hypothetical protein
MIGFIQALGSCESPDKMYSYITPTFPDFSKFDKNKSLSGINHVHGICRVPIIPHQQEFLRRFGHDIASYNKRYDRFEPEALPLVTGTNTYLGLDSSSATDPDFQTLVFNLAFFLSFESNENIGNFTLSQRQTRVKRWSIPRLDDKEDFTQLETFLFGNGEETHWIRQLQRISASVNKFFPGSTNLAAIPPTTTMENYTEVHF